MRNKLNFNSSKRFSATLILLVVSLFMVSFVSAFEFDNVQDSINIKEGDSFQIGNKELAYRTLWKKYKPIEVKNCALWIGTCLIEGETLFKLSNGQIWEQSSYDYTYHYAYHPEVLIYKTSGGYKMKVDGVNETIYVRRIK